uniref:nucleolar protein 7 n=1 Tax=Doryrhamphus excisus TaxID=161450 RepID=UPI0025AE9987|nr:nucleolar protein 7 [Doryrhamphus excisus]
MATRKRGLRARSSEMQQNEQAMKTCGEEFDSSDDEGPEEVTFEDSKVEALRSAQQALETARREKELLKEKRKKRQQLFQEQKKKKLLSLEVLEEIDSSRDSPSKDGQKAPVASQDEKHHKRRMTEQKPRRSRKLTGRCKVMTVKSQEMSCQQKTAEDFINSCLYGARSRRTTNNQLLSLRSKTAPKKSSAVQFVKEEWAQEEKGKAEKIKMRWLQKNIPSS